MALYLHNPKSDAHLEELRDRLAWHPACRRRTAAGIGPDLEAIEALVAVVRAMDRGEVSTGQAIETFTRAGVPSFSRWLVDMIDEGVYRDSRLERAHDDRGAWPQRVAAA